MEKLRGKWKAPEVNRILVESSQKALSSLQPITFDQLYKRQIADTQRLTFPQPEDLPEKEFEDEELDYSEDREREYPVLPLVNEGKSSQDNTFGHFSVRPITP